MTAKSESPVVLGIDTATVVNVGLAAGDQVLAVATVAEARAHAEQLMPLVNQCLAEGSCRLADVDHLVVGMGPGPFTGLRVGIATAQMLSTVRSIPLHGVCTLDVLAAQYATQWAPEDAFVVATDARRREVYWAHYAAAGARRDGPHVGSPDDVSFENFIAKLKVNEGKLKAQYNCRAVRFRVVTKDGKVTLKPVPIYA